jgi:2,3-bisphosphoglycerate-independent phosphoglycerate mutase
VFKITSKIKPVVLCILDGWGIASDYPGNAITRANPVNFNSLWFSYPHTYLSTTGQSVGLPEGQVGNSEVGHLNLGAGKIVFQDLLRINLAISNGSFFENEAFLGALNHLSENNSNLHLIGLVGFGGVHSDIDHLFALLSLFQKAQLPYKRIKIHIFTDGRDSPPTSAKNYLSQIIAKIDSEKLGQIASISGRYYAMDRDNRWERTEQAYLALTGKTENKANEPLSFIEKCYSEGTTDEFIKPTVISDSDGNPLGKIGANDAVIFFNFRPDRARQLTKAFVLDDFKTVKTPSQDTIKTFDRGPKLKNLYFVTLTRYEKNLPVSAIAFLPQEVPMPIARVFSERNDRQFHISETEKYAHVTYFFNGGKEQPFHGEDRLLINSPKVSSYDQKPQMSALQITKSLVNKIDSRVYDFIVVNYANADMVAHTGNFEATLEAVKVVDQSIGIVAKSALSAGGAVLITADHGNAEEMINHSTGQVDTEHNGNPAPLIIVAGELRGKSHQLPQGLLADVSPTILGMLGIPKPSQMTGRDLLQ